MTDKTSLHYLNAEIGEGSSSNLEKEIKTISQKMDLMISEFNSIKGGTMNYPLRAKLLNISQLAKILGVAPGTLYNKVSRGEIPYIKVGGSIRFTENELSQIVRNESRESLCHDVYTKLKIKKKPV